jgi:hypothetical protein
MKKNQVINILLELLETICCIVGKITAELVNSFPVLKKYVLAFLSGARELISEMMSEKSTS